MARKQRPPPFFDQILFGRAEAEAPAIARPTVSVFVYDRAVFFGDQAKLLPMDQGRFATARGKLLRGPRRRFGFVPGNEGAVRGEIVEVEPSQLGVLDFVVGAVGGPFVRETIQVSVNLVPTPAQTWVLTDDRGYSPLKRRA